MEIKVSDEVAYNVEERDRNGTTGHRSNWVRRTSSKLKGFVTDTREANR